MKAKEARCSNCEALVAQVAELQASVVFLTRQVETLKEQRAKAKKDSSTSSKPPSSDFVNPNKKIGKGLRVVTIIDAWSVEIIDGNCWV